MLNISLDDQRRQPNGRLVHEQNLGAGHQPPGDGQHLLLASRQGAGKLPLAFLQARKTPVHGLDVGGDLLRGSPPGIGAGMEILLDVHARKDQTVLGHQGEAPGDHPAGGKARYVFAVQSDGAGYGREDARDGEHGRGFACAVRAEQTRDFALGRIQADAPQRLNLPVGGDDVPNAQHVLSHPCRQEGIPTRPSPGKPPARLCCAARRLGSRMRSSARN